MRWPLRIIPEVSKAGRRTTVYFSQHPFANFWCRSSIRFLTFKRTLLAAFWSLYLWAWRMKCVDHHSVACRSCDRVERCDQSPADPTPRPSHWGQIPSGTSSLLDPIQSCFGSWNPSLPWLGSRQDRSLSISVEVRGTHAPVYSSLACCHTPAGLAETPDSGACLYQIPSDQHPSGGSSASCAPLWTDGRLSSTGTSDGTFLFLLQNLP